MKSKVTSKKVLISAIAFADNMDLVIEGDEVEDIMNQMLRKFDDLHIATGEYIEFGKSKYCTQ